MTGPAVDLSLTPVIDDLLACLADEVALVADPPAQVMLRPGTQIELLLSTTRDECCEGLAWVRPVSIYPSASFPVQDADYRHCWPVQWAAVLEMGVARCAPTPEASQLTSAQEWDAVTHAVLDDAAAMRRAMCCFTMLRPDWMYLIGLWQPIATEGGCLGGTMLVTVMLGDCDCDRTG